MKYKYNVLGVLLRKARWNKLVKPDLLQHLYCREEAFFHGMISTRTNLINELLNMSKVEIDITKSLTPRELM